MKFEINETNWLHAVGTPERLEVYRAVALHDDDPEYVRVIEYAKTHGLVPGETEVHEDEYMFGESAEYTVYTKPEVTE